MCEAIISQKQKPVVRLGKYSQLFVLIFLGEPIAVIAYNTNRQDKASEKFGVVGIDHLFHQFCKWCGNNRAVATVDNSQHFTFFIPDLLQ